MIHRFLPQNTEFRLSVSIIVYCPRVRNGILTHVHSESRLATPLRSYEATLHLTFALPRFTALFPLLPLGTRIPLFSSHPALSYRFPLTDLEWKIIYVGSADSEKYDQELDSVLVGPVAQGAMKFVFTVRLFPLLHSSPRLSTPPDFPLPFSSVSHGHGAKSTTSSHRPLFPSPRPMGLTPSVSRSRSCWA